MADHHLDSAVNYEDVPAIGHELPREVRDLLTRVAVRDRVTSADFADAFLTLVDLPAPTRDVVLGSLMTAVMERGPAFADVAALLEVALSLDERQPAEVISGGDYPVLMLAGSGKKGVLTLNVSTLAALVAAAAGARIIKVGSAATSSMVGSRELVHALGLREHRTADSVRADLAAFGFAFVAIEPEIPVLNGLYGRRFHVPNPFSFGLAPLASPVIGDVTVYGLSHPRVELAAQVLRRFGLRHVEVFSTRLPTGHYLDEIGPTGELRWCRVRDGDVGQVEVLVAGNSVAALGLPTDLPVPHGRVEAIERAGELLSGQGLASHRVVVVLNAANLLVLSGLATTFRQGRTMAEDVLRGGVVLTDLQAASGTVDVRDGTEA
jgi:anthranilate phosphoribosyltransferase